jgi:peptidyl-dipeptidase Dcp
MLPFFASQIAALSAIAFCIAAPVALAAESTDINPVLADWVGPYGGVPAFDKIKVEHFQPALMQAMDENRREIAAIADDPEPPTFGNTNLALERAGKTMNRVSTIYGVWGSTMSDSAYRAVQRDMAPKLSAFRDELSNNSKLFARIKAVYDARLTSGLTPEDQRLVWFYYSRFVRQGAQLDDAQKARKTEINQKLAGLYTKFAQNALADEEEGGLVLNSRTDLDGLSAEVMASAAAEAERRKLPGKWVIANTRSAMEPFLTYATNRALREAAFKIFAKRGDNGDAHDNNQIARDILMLRVERSNLLGFPTYAHWNLADAMAKDPNRAMELMLKVWKPAIAQVKRDVAAMQAVVKAEGGTFKIAPWDYRFYAEKVRKAKYDLDMEEVKPYLQLDHIREAMFWAAGRLYGFTFTKIEDAPVYHPTMTVYKVTGGNGAFVGLWYFDPYARAGKNSGAWMNAYRPQQKFDVASDTIVSNNSNFIQAKPGEPVLISWTDATTMFHEFGHALHGLNSNVTYASLSGTRTARDFVEFPSQINEHWLSTPEVLKFLVNAKGEPLPAALVAKIARAKTFNEGFKTTEYLSSAIVDMKLHLAGASVGDMATFEKTTLAELGMPAQIVMRHRIPHFSHVFSGEGYAAGYYSYLWSEVLDHDAFEAFTEAGGPYDPAVAKRLHDHIMSVGNTIDPAEAYRQFRGRDPNVNALLRARGFPVPKG